MLWRRTSLPQGADRLSPLPSDVLVTVLSFLPAFDVDTSVKLVSKTLRRESDSAALWRSFCHRTGKLDKSVSEIPNCPDDEISSNPFRDLYYKIPCVPEDFESIKAAVKHCPWRGTVTLMPGVYKERLDVRKAIHVRAAFPEIGLAICWYNGTNEPCIAVTGGEDGRKMHVMISHIQLFHSTAGTDIWGGNCAVMAEGEETTLALTSCTLQSDSGRGIVAVDDATLHLKNTVVHDCAATGLYLGDSGSMASIKQCNIIRNGGGSRRSQRSDLNDDEEDDSEAVPAGHSGMYVESGVALIEDSLIAGNSLTGLSVVRGGVVRISGCDVTENGSDPILVEDAFDFDRSARRNTRIQGGVLEGPAPNNYTSRGDVRPLVDESLRTPVRLERRQHRIGELPEPCRIVLGGKMRATQFAHVMDKMMTSEALENRYREQQDESTAMVR